MTFAEDDWHRRKQIVELPGSKRMAFVDTGGSSPALLMLHGFSDTSRSFAMLEPLLSGYRLIMPDMPGHGGSALGAGTRIRDFATGMISLLNRIDVTPVAIVGHSMGAMTAIDIASRTALTAIILLSASLKPDFGSESPIAQAIRSLRDPIDPSGDFLRQWYACAMPVDPDFLMKMKIDAAAMPAAVWHGILEGFASTDLTQHAAQIAAPVLCVGGSSDPLFGLSHRRGLSSAFSSVRSVTLEGHGHNPHWEDPKIVAQHLLSFLSELRGS